jgi:hypothetical protein
VSLPMTAPSQVTLSNPSQEGTVDAMLDSKGDMLSQQDSSSMIHNSQADLESDRLESFLPIPSNDGINSIEQGTTTCWIRKTRESI